MSDLVHLFGLEDTLEDLEYRIGPEYIIPNVTTTMFVLPKEEQETITVTLLTSEGAYKLAHLVDTPRFEKIRSALYDLGFWSQKYPNAVTADNTLWFKTNEVKTLLSIDVFGYPSVKGEIRYIDNEQYISYDGLKSLIEQSNDSLIDWINKLKPSIGILGTSFCVSSTSFSFNPNQKLLTLSESISPNSYYTSKFQVTTKDSDTSQSDVQYKPLNDWLDSKEIIYLEEAYYWLAYHGLIFKRCNGSWSPTLHAFKLGVVKPVIKDNRAGYEWNTSTLEDVFTEYDIVKFKQDWKYATQSW